MLLSILGLQATVFAIMEPWATPSPQTPDPRPTQSPHAAEAPRAQRVQLPLPVSD